MALVKCKECGSEVSTKADACPKCGAKVKKGMGCGSLLVICLGVLIVVAIATPSSPSSSAPSSSSSSSTPSKPREIVENSAWDGSVRQVERYLKSNLKDPDSYQSIEWSAVSKSSGGGFMVRHKYRAKNSFGGYVIENQVFTLDAQGNVTGAIPYE
mgnify:CR=1 FL=1|jgi:hypothetical protein